MNKKYLLIILFGIFLIIFLSVFVLSGVGGDKQACLSLTFDDGLKSHYDVVYPLLKEKNFSASFFIVANETALKERFIYDRELMNKEQIKEISNGGFEIGSHTLTHPILTELTEGEIERELKESKTILEKEYKINIESVAFPRWISDDKVIDLARKYYLTARVVYNKNPTAFFLESFAVKNTSEVEDICKYIDYSKRNKFWFVVVFHDISNDPLLWDTSVGDFKEILNCAERSGIKVDSIKGCREEIFEQQ